MRYSFSGTVSPDSRLRRVLLNVVERLRDPTEITTGLADGIDTEAMLAAYHLYPDALHRVVVPRGPFNKDALAFAKSHGFAVIYAPERAHPYRPRNLLLVQYADELEALPEGPEKAHPRSGTWMTVRIAHDHGVPVKVHGLKGES